MPGYGNLDLTKPDFIPGPPAAHLTSNCFSNNVHFNRGDIMSKMGLWFWQGKFISQHVGYEVDEAGDSYQHPSQGAFLLPGMGVGINLERCVALFSSEYWFLNLFY